MDATAAGNLAAGNLAAGNLIESFSRIEDPRSDSGKRHDLMDIISITICAAICVEGWSDVGLFGKSKYDWLKRFLKLPNGIPSHDTSIT